MISVIMPVYNAARFLKASIESILSQTEQDLELIIINDGSTDNSEEIILSFTDKRIKYVRQQNSGVGAAREAALQLAQGEFIAFQDADDISLPCRLQSMKEKFICPEVGIVHSDMLLIDEADQPLGYWAANNISKERLLRFFLKIGTPFNNPTMMLRRAAIGDFHYDAALHIGEDTEMVFNVAPHWHTVHIPEPLVLYRRYAASTSRQGDYLVHTLHFKKFMQNHSLQELFPELCWDAQAAMSSQGMAAALTALFLARRGYIYDAREWLAQAGNCACHTDAQHFIAAVGHILSGQYDSAVALLEACARRDHVLENYLGEVKALQGDFAQAAGHFLKSLQLQPGYIEPVDNLKALGICQGIHFIDANWAKFVNKRGG